jgi:hypothetical protein
MSLRPFVVAALLLVLPGCKRSIPTTGESASATSVQPEPLGAEPKSGDQIPVNRYIVVDQFGYRPEMQKVAVLVDPVTGWNAQDEFKPGDHYEVRRWSDAKVMFSGKPAPWGGGRVQPNAGDRGGWFDFSSLAEPGSYFVFDRDRRQRSDRFDIDPNVYRDVLGAATRMFYFNRANFAKAKPFACVKDKCWLQGRDYMGPGQDSEARSVKDRENAKTARDLSGGWWDAGDTDKYTTFTESTLHQMLSAYAENPKAFSDATNIPESGNGIPDLIDEIKVELDWLRKMQAPDLGGGALLKLGNVDYGDPVPEQSKLRRFYYPGSCSSATITVASVFAHAALVLRGIPALKSYAADLDDRAVKAWKHYQSHPRSDACDDGTIKSGDADRSLADQDAISVVAAVYLFALTGDAAYTDVVKKLIGVTRPFKEDRWSVYDPDQGDALLYYAALPNADKELAASIVNRKKADFAKQEFYAFKPELDLYRAYVREDSYHWGSNNPRANFGNTNWDLIQYDLVSGDQAASVRERAAGILHSFHGVNPMQLVYLSNMTAYGAERSVNEIYHAWFRDGDKRWDSVKTSEFGPAPGYVTGGPNKSYCSGRDDHDHRCYSSAFRTQPAQKAYIDFNTAWDPKAEYDSSWALTEPAIYYQAAYVKLLSKFVP